MGSIIASRLWRGYGETRAMQALAVEQRRRLGSRAPWHVGDIAWGLRQHEGREHEWTIRIWEEGGDVVAWSWLKGATGALEFDLRLDRLHLLDEILDVPEARRAFAFEDDEDVRAELERHGFVAPVSAMHYLVRDLAALPEPKRLPEGFRCRTVRPGDLAERVAVHRHVWAPSRVTESSFANVQATWPYRASLDCVVEGPDGRFAANFHSWPDDANGVGELEPVGVRSDHRRKGLGAAVCSFALGRLRDEGLRHAIVYCFEEPARALYESIGFERHAVLVGYSR
jgi:GNAT superfamily N-acetyltransferase